MSKKKFCFWKHPGKRHKVKKPKTKKLRVHRTSVKVSEGKFTRRAGWKDRHHILAKSRGGPKTDWNLIWLDRHRHEAYHLLFGNMTFEEAAECLLRALKIKAEQENPDYNL